MKKILLLAAGMAVGGMAFAQWSNSMEDPVNIFPTGTTSYATEVSVSPDGSVWAIMYHPNTANAEGEADIKNVVYEYVLQHFDKEGNAQFEGDGILISDYNNISYTVVNNYLWVDRDGNAIVSVADSRNSTGSGRSYTVYKIAPDGTMLWGEDGVALSDAAAPSDLSACMRMVQIEDGSYIFAWTEIKNEDQCIKLQRLNKDGKALWDLSKMTINDGQTSYPYLVNSGSNTFILVYARSASQVIYARKLDFDGEQVWGKDTRIYRGGWGSIPIHTLLDVKPSGNGGVIVGWTDDRNNTNIETAYMSYVTSDGELGFAGQSDEADTKLTYDDWRCFNLKITPASDGSGFYAIWRRTNADQNFQGVSMQKVSLDGELLWGDDAQDIFPYEQTSLGYLSIQPAEDGGACAFFQQYSDYYDQHGFAARFDTDGNFVWPDKMILVTQNHRQASNLSSQPYGEHSWLLNWCDGGTGPDDKESTYVMELFNDNGTFGLEDSGVNEVSMENEQIKISGNEIVTTLADGTQLSVYDVAGRCVATTVVNSGSAAVNLSQGIYLLKASSGDTLKFSVK